MSRGRVSGVGGREGEEEIELEGVRSGVGMLDPMVSGLKENSGSRASVFLSSVRSTITVSSR